MCRGPSSPAPCSRRCRAWCSSSRCSASPVRWGVVVLSRFRAASLVRPTLLAGLGTCGAGLLFSLVFWGHPLASAESSVIVGPDGATASIPLAFGLDALALLGEGPSPSRAILPLILSLPLAALALLFDPARVDRRLVVALAVLTGVLAIPGVALRNHAITPTAVVLLVSAAGLVVMAVSEGIASLVARYGAGRTASVATALALMLLLMVGLSRRAAAEGEPFWIGTPRSVRQATVLLGDAPCDFLAWENMAWECAMLDGGATGRVGLALPEGSRIAGVEHVMVLGPLHAQGLERHRRAPLRPKAVRARKEVRLEDRLQHQLRRSLDHTVPYRRDPQRPLLSISLRDVPPQDHGRTVRPLAKRSRDLFQEERHAMLLDLRERHTIDARCSSIAAHLLPRHPEHVTAPDVVVQRVEAPTRSPLGCGPQSPLQLSHFCAWRDATGVVRSAPGGHSLALSIARARAGHATPSQAAPTPMNSHIVAASLRAAARMSSKLRVEIGKNADTCSW
jgi:hypothetical protein